MNSRIFLVLAIFTGFLVPFSSIAQRKGYTVQKKQKTRHEAYPNPYDYWANGWMFDAGLSATTSFDETTTLFSNKAGDSTLSAIPGIRPGFILNVGRYHSMKKWHKIVKYFDYNLGYKFLWNTEDQELNVANIDFLKRNTLNNYAHYVSLNFNLNNVISFSDYIFMQNSLGVNADLRFLSVISGTGWNTRIQPDLFVAQIHYKLGIGIMLSHDIALIPYVEVPLFNLYPQQKQFSQLDYFNNSYQTFIVGVRLMLFTLGQKDCPTAKGTTVNPNQQNGY